ncbi:MAG: Fe-S cluster assembly protein SufB [Patescibacteria group bacterium]|nr:Fe-S cluster assembly protein SufB [Patescibacteria group bacterium]
MNKERDLKNLKSSYKLGFSVPEDYVFKSKKGLDEKVVEEISAIKSEPLWMRDLRLKSYQTFRQKQMPGWGGDLSQINFNEIYYYLKPTKTEAKSWEDLPKGIRETYNKIGVPAAEKKYLAGVKGQYESEVIYGSLLKSLEEKGVVFLGMDEGLKRYPDLVKEYFGTVIPPADNKFAALNSSVWSGGSFIYVPKNVKISLPLQAYFRINAANMGQFERTLIIADEGSFVSYIEGCSAPVYSTDSLHSAVVEIIVKRGARVRYTTIQNWSTNVYNLVTKRAKVFGDGVMEWVDYNGGSRLTMKYPSVYLVEPGAHGEILSLAFAGSGQHQDTGGKAIHAAPNTTSQIISKSVSLNGGRTSYRGLLQIYPGAKGSKSKVVCDALILDPQSRSDTYPTMRIDESQVQVEHEATVSKIGEDQLFYLMSRGIPEAQAGSLIVSGFVEPIVKQLPLEYAVELNRLIELQMEGSVG